jgi:hypothetical protein
VADIGLQAIDGQDDPLLPLQEPPQPLGVRRGQGAEFVIALEQVGHRALRDDDVAAAQFLMNLGDAAMLGVAEAADQSDDIEAELVVGQGEVWFGLRAVGPVIAGTVSLGTAADLERQARDGVQRGDGAVIGLGEVEAVTTLGATDRHRFQRLHMVGRGRQCVRGIESTSSHRPYVHYAAAPS